MSSHRILDYLILSLLAIPSIFIVGFLAIAIRWETLGSAFFTQQRVGRHQKPFIIVKLRTMHSGTQNVASHQVSVSQITKLGKLLRKTKLDELPQLWCILKGEMSFVGPRPCLLVQKDLIEFRELYGVFSVLPGITGPAQLAGIDMSTPETLAIADGKYVKSKNLFYDIKILLATLCGGFGLDAATSFSRVDRNKENEDN